MRDRKSFKMGMKPRDQFFSGAESEPAWITEEVSDFVNELRRVRPRHWQET